MGKEVEIAPVASDSCSRWVCWGGECVAGQLRERAGTGGPAALAVFFSGLGCFGSIPGSPWLGR